MYPRLDNQDGVEQQELEERAKALLDRVLLMRVFDFVGVVEAVGEIGASLESDRGGAGDGGMEGIRGNGNQDGVEEIEAGKSSEMERDGDSGKGSVGMIIINSMTNVVSSMMSKDHVQGQSVPLSLPPPPTLSSSMVSTSSVAALTNKPPTPRPCPPNHLPPLPPPPDPHPPPQHPPPQLRRRYATPTTFRQARRRDKQRQYLRVHTG